MSILRRSLRARLAALFLVVATTVIAAFSVPEPAIGKTTPKARKRHFDAGVTITPAQQVVPGSTVDVDVMWCNYDESPFLVDFDFQFNEQDVTGDFTQTGSGNQDFGCEMWWEFEGTLTIPDAPGTYVFRARAHDNTSASYEDYGYYFRAFKWQQVKVIADPSDRVVTAGSTGNTQTFTVWNLGALSADYTLSASCSGSGVSSCNLSPSSLSSIAAGDSGVATVTFTGGSNGTTGTIQLIATDNSQTAPADTAKADVTAQTAPSAGVTLVRSLGTLHRGACVTVAVASDGAMECGDLRIVHALPPVATMGQTRTPTLLYNSALARQDPVVQADVTIPCPLPTTVEARVYVGGIQEGYGSWSGSDWGSCGKTRRISVYTGLASFGTSVFNHYVQMTYTGGAGGTATSSTELIAAVDRTGSSFGAGWWLAGLERIAVVSGSTLLWIGGDGSTAVYTGGPNTYINTAFDHSDTISYNGAGEYTRQGPGNVDAKFNSSGYHISTTNRQGHVTRFTYVAGTDHLDSLIVPVRTGSPLVYRFVYTSGLLDSIIAPAAGTSRNVKLTHSGSVVTSIRDADGTTVSFGYLGGANANIVSSRTDRRGNTTYFAYNSANQLIKDSLDLGSGKFVKQVLRPAESASLSTALSLDASYTSIDGARTDVADITKIWVNQFGQPTRIRDGEGAETVLHYDGTWPGLVNETRSPTRMVTHSFYNGTTGLVDSTVAYNPLGTGSNAVTKYTWNTTWRAPVSIVSPTGVIDSMGYDGSGNRSWAQTGGISHRVTFTYTSENLDSAVTLPSGVGSPATRIAHDALGNVSDVINPKGHVSFTRYNAIGQPTLIGTPLDSTHASGFSDSAYYKIVSRKYSRADRDSLTVTSGPSVTLPSPYGTVTTKPLTVWQLYDAEGNPTSTRRTFSYDSVNIQLSYNLLDSAVFDAANRTTKSITPGSSTTYTLDPAGNVVALTDGRGYVDSMKYDRANRLVRKIIPKVTDDSVACTATGINWPAPPFSCSYSLPTIGGSVCIDADTVYFGYNGVGRLQSAYNKYAHVRRAYNPNGSIKSETQGIRAYYEPAATPCQTSPSYALIEAAFDDNVLTYTYDLAGNRTGLESPVTTGCTGTCTTTWSYSGTTGQLSSVADESAGTTSFTYDDAGRLTGIGTPGNWTDSRTLDALGQTYRREVSGSSNAISDTIAYDPAGRIRRAGVGYRAGGSGLPVETWYNPHGAVLAANGATTATGGTTTEFFDVDAIGNRRYTRANNLRPQAHADVNAIRTNSVNAYGQLTAIVRDTTTFYFKQLLWYEGTGNLSLSTRTELDYLNSTNLWVADKHWYTGDGKLAIFNRAVGPSANDETHPGEHTVYEEYRYDAFGRRVGTRRRMVWSCSSTNSDCASTWTRTVWDGDQVLLEIRTQGGDGVTGLTMEASSPTSGSSNAYPYGRVRYVHAGGIDQPIAVIRYGLTGAGTSDPYVVFPYTNWRGQYESGHLSNGTICYAGSTCIEIAWPGAVTSIDGANMNPTTGHAWFGSLITGNTDGSGMSYLRNRYYDPRTGRFTQTDPIGLAGGMNGYGFAGGDRINFGDPFGLCKDSKGNPLPMAVCDRPIESQMSNRSIVKGAAAIASASLVGRLISAGLDALLGSEVSTSISDKIGRQMGRRGWTVDQIDNTIESPFTTRPATNRANKNPATAFYNEDGSYVVRDNKTGGVVQISNKNDPNWKPDPSIKNPYKPGGGS